MPITFDLKAETTLEQRRLIASLHQMLTASYPHRPKNLTTLRLFVPSEMVSEALNAGPWVSWQEKSDHGRRYIGMMIFMMACIGSRWRYIQV